MRRRGRNMSGRTETRGKERKGEIELFLSSFSVSLFFLPFVSSFFIFLSSFSSKRKRGVGQKRIKRRKERKEIVEKWERRGNEKKRKGKFEEREKREIY